jgi:hypothetical protein
MACQYHVEEAARGEGERVMKEPETPFHRHWLYYLILKYAVLVGAVVISLYTVYRRYRG